MQSLFMGHFLNRLQVLEAAPGCLAKTAEHQLPDNEWMGHDEVILGQRSQAAVRALAEPRAAG
jgi:hypothetical protein